MRLLPFLALIACGCPDPGPADVSVCPADAVGCSSYVGFAQEQYDHTPCLTACRDWADDDLDAAVTFLCSVRPGRSDLVDDVYLLDHALNGVQDPNQAADVLRATAANCPRGTVDRLAERMRGHLILERDWSPVRQAAADVARDHGSSPAVDRLAGGE